MSDKVSLNKSNEKVKKVSYGAGFTSSVSSNYEKMQALAYCYAVLPF